MENLEIVKKRYMADNLSVRLGGIAANLARVSSFLENKANREVVVPILEESKYFIEWTAPESPLGTQALLSEIQPSLALWQRLLLKDPMDRIMGTIKEKAQSWSSKVLELSGLLGE